MACQAKFFIFNKIEMKFTFSFNFVEEARNFQGTIFFGKGLTNIEHVVYC
ncbi:MAG: hypothetical protein KatS3mg006_0216 [Pyrinomonadaceae bacterium]|nr:MAG: hypothetical protein KatS3mg006_0216 [Pyrinomonadaceae bacterium]